MIGVNPDLPSTLGEQSSDYGYVPVDGLAVQLGQEAGTCKDKGRPLKEDDYLGLSQALPDISVRFAVASLDAGGGLSFGPNKLTVKGGRYRAVVDYVNVDVVPVNFAVSAIVSEGTRISLSEARMKAKQIVGYAVRRLPDLKVGERQSNPLGSPDTTNREEDPVTIPVYVGVGLRLTADVIALKGNVALVGLGVIGAEAQSSNLTGTLTIQTIGLAGPTVAASLPLPSKLDQSTIESSIMALGANRKEIYSSNNSLALAPRVVGIYSPIGTSSALINALYSELSRERPVWNRKCKS